MRSSKGLSIECGFKFLKVPAENFFSESIWPTFGSLHEQHLVGGNQAPYCSQSKTNNRNNIRRFWNHLFRFFFWTLRTERRHETKLPQGIWNIRKERKAATVCSGQTRGDRVRCGVAAVLQQSAVVFMMYPVHTNTRSFRCVLIQFYSISVPWKQKWNPELEAVLFWITM